MKRIRINFTIIVVILGMALVQPLCALIIGSDFALSREGFVNFPASDSDNEIRGFASMANGFALEDGTTICSYNAFFPIEKQMTLNGGTLLLSKDMALSFVSTVTSLGDIRATIPTVIKFPNTFVQLGSSSDKVVHEFENISLVFDSPVQLQGAIRFEGTCSINGLGHALDMNGTGSLIIAPGSSLALHNLTLTHVIDDNIRCEDDSAVLILDNVGWVLAADYSFDTGSIIFEHTVDMTGSFTFIYASALTSTVSAGAQWGLKNGISLFMGRSVESGSDPLYFVNDTSMLVFDNCTLYTAPMGLHLTRGSAQFVHDVVFHMLSTSTSNGFIMGTGQAGDDFTFFLNPSAVWTIGPGHFTYNCASPDAWVSQERTARIIREENNYYFAAQNQHVNHFTFKTASNLVPPTQVAPDKAITISDAVYQLPDVIFDISSAIRSGQLFILSGGNSFFFTKGIMLPTVHIQGAGNTYFGNAVIAGPTILDDANAQLIWSLGSNGKLAYPITMNNGTITLSDSLVLDSGIVLTGPGTVELNGSSVDFGGKVATSWSTPLRWVDAGGRINLNTFTTLASTWTFQGDCTIDGNSNTLDLGQLGLILVNEGSSLTLKNMRLTNIHGTNIRCLGDDSLLILDDVQWLQSADYTFNRGAITFVDRVSMIGSTTFIYDSIQTSTLTSGSTWRITQGMTLSIGKNPISGNDPLSFADATAQMIFDECTLVTTPLGLHLTKGTAQFDNNVVIEILSTSTTTGLVLGTGQPGYDFSFLFNPATVLVFDAGHFVYNNFDPIRLKSKAKTARIVRNIASRNFVAQNQSFSNFTIEYTSTSVTPPTISPGKSLTISNGAINLPNVIFDVTSCQVNGQNIIVSGNSTIFFGKGLMLPPIVVSGTNNTLLGTATIAGPVVLTSGSAQVIWDVNGRLAFPITLNNGTLTLANNLNFAQGIVITGPGTIDLAASTANLGSKVTTTWSTPLRWNGSDARINLNANVSLTSTWTFSGSCTINGNGRILDLGNTGNMLINSGARLKLQNIIMQNIRNNNIRCIGDSSVLELEDVTWLQSNSFTFTTGAIEFGGRSIMRGIDTFFVYQSVQTSTVKSNSQLTLDPRFTFSYDLPMFTGSPRKLEFIDETSTLVLNSASLVATGTGLSLTKGTLRVRTSSNIGSEAIVQEGGIVADFGITIGDRTSANDFHIDVLPQVELRLVSGSLNYNNVDPSSLQLQHHLSALHIFTDAALKLYENIYPGLGRIIFEDRARLARTLATNVIGSIEPRGFLGREFLAT